MSLRLKIALCLGALVLLPSATQLPIEPAAAALEQPQILRQEKANKETRPATPKLKNLLSLVTSIDRQAWIGNSRQVLEKITGRTMHPVSENVVADLVEYQTDFRRSQTVQKVKSCLVKNDNTNCVELIIDPAQSISPEEVATTFGKWTRKADEDEQIMPESLVFIYERGYGQMRFEFKGREKPSLIAVYITSTRGRG